MLLAAQLGPIALNIALEFVNIYSIFFLFTF